MLGVQPSNSTIVDAYFNQLLDQPPFSFLEPDCLRNWLSDSKLLRAKPGETIVSYKSLQDRIYLVIDGQVRLLKINENGSIDTLAKRGSGQLLGWVSLLRAGPTEWITASENCTLLALPADNFLSAIKENIKFKNWFGSLTQPQESTIVALAVLDENSQKFENWQSLVAKQVKQSVVVTLEKSCIFSPPKNSKFDNYNWYLSTCGLPAHPVGTLIKTGSSLNIPDSFTLPLRIIGIPSSQYFSSVPTKSDSGFSDLGALPSVSLQQFRDS